MFHPSRGVIFAKKASLSVFRHPSHRRDRFARFLFLENNGRGEWSSTTCLYASCICNLDRHGRSDRDREPEWGGRQCLVRVWNRSRVVDMDSDAPSGKATRLDSTLLQSVGSGIQSLYDILLSSCCQQPVRGAEGRNSGFSDRRVLYCHRGQHHPRWRPERLRTDVEQSPQEFEGISQHDCKLGCRRRHLRSRSKIHVFDVVDGTMGEIFPGHVRYERCPPARTGSERQGKGAGGSGISRVL